MSLLARFTQTRMPPELKERLRATREAALTQLIRGVMLVALMALVAFSYNAIRNPQAGAIVAVISNSILFGVLVVLNFLRRLRYVIRAATFALLLYGVALVLLATTGIGSAGRLYLLAFAVITTIFFGMRIGLWAAVLSLATWAAFAIAFSFFLPAPVGPDSAVFTDWLSAFFGLLLLLVALIIPQRQFLETQTTAIITAFEKSALEEARAALQKKTEELEAASGEATLINQQLQTQAEVIQHRAAQLALSAEVARSVASLHDLPELLNTTVQLISERFDYYHAGIFLADDAREWAVLQAASSEGGQRMLAREHRLRIGRQGIVGYVMAAGQPRIAQDVGGDIVHYVNPDLPETRSEMALPISARGSVIGALDVQSTTANAFSDEDVRVLQSLADQLGVAIENARLFAATQRNIEELRALQREARRQGPTLGEAAPTGYRYDGVNVVMLLPGESGSQAPTPGTLHIPLNVGDEALGVIEIKRQGNEVWSPDDVELTEAIANRMTLALENARLYEQAQARAQQMTNLSEAALELTGPQFSLSQLLDLIGKRGLKLFNADYVGVWLPAGQNELELRAAQTATAILTPGRRLKRGEGLAGEVLASGRITRLDDYQTWSGRTEPGEVILRSVLGVPMTWQHDVLGVLVLSHTETERKFTNEDERSARLFATQAAAALENARLLQETQDRISELATINTVSQVATAQLDLTTLLDTIGEQIFHTFRVSTGYIALYNPDTNLIDFPYVLENGERLLNYPPMQYGDGLSSIILRSRQPMLVNRETERRLTTLGAQLTGAPAQSFLGVPIVVGETAIGLISLQSIEAEGLFDEADQRLLTTIAASVGAALQNARLFEQTQRRVAELGTINAISQTLASSQLDLRATLSLVGDRILQTFPEADGGYIALYNSRTNQIEIPYFRDADGGQVSVPPVALGRGLSSHIIQTRQPLLVNQDTVQRLQALGAIITGQPAQSYLGVPMIVGDEVVGVLSVQSLAREGLFNDGDVRLLVTIAANVGVALENARLFEQTQAALSENRTLFLISRTLAQVTTIAEILDTVVTYALPAGADRASLITFHATEQDEISELEVVGFRDLKDEYQRLGLRLPAAAAPFITRLGAEPVVIPDTHAAPDLDMFTRQTFQQFDIQATCLLPLRAGGKLIGLLTTSARQPTPFDAEAMPLLQATADQVAVTMEKLRLLAETQRRADQLATAAEVSRVANSVLDPDQLIVRVVELIRERFNLYYSALFLVDENGQWARLRHATGDAGRTLLERGHQLEVGGNSMIGQAVARREARIALDVGVGGSRQTEAARFVNPLLPDTRSEMALPLAVGPTVIGAVSVQSTQPNAFSPADITVLQTMVDQVAISLQNARLFTAAQRELAERTRAEALLAGQRRILELIAQSQALPHVLDALARFVEERSERALCSILLMDSNGQNLRRGAAPSLPPDFTDTVDGLLIGPRAGSCGTAAFLKQQVITTDIVNDPLWVDYRDWIVGTHGLRAAWSTPILSVNNQVLGTVALYHREVKAPTPRELELMGIATYLAGIAIARYQSQQALDYERYLLHTLLENVPDKIYFKDRESHFIRASRGVSTQFGLTQDEIVGKSDFDFFTAEHARQAYKDEQEMLSTGQNVIGKLERETWPDRPDTWVLTSKLVMRDVGGDVIGSFGISRDVTELKQAQDAAQRRAQLLAAAAEIGRAATASLDVETLLRTSVNLIRDRFGFYHASIFIIDSKTNMAVVRESTGEAGAALKARGHQLAVGSNSLVGRATATRQPVVVQDVTTDLNHFKNPLLPDTRAEAVLPLVSGDRVIGALDVQSASAHAFAVEDMAILATIADQLAVAIQNANLFDRTARTARREQLVGEITNKIRAASSIEAMLQTAVTELRQALGVSHGVVRLGSTSPLAPPAIEDKPEGNGHGSNGSKGNGASGV